MRELPAVRAERVRLDQLRAGVDEADVQRDDRLGRPEVGLLRAAEPWHGRGQQRAHAAVADDGGSVTSAVRESDRWLRGHSRLLPTRSTHPPGSRPTGFGTLPRRQVAEGVTGPVPSAFSRCRAGRARFLRRSTDPRKRKRGRRLAPPGSPWKEILRGCPRRIGATLGMSSDYREEGALHPSPVWLTRHLTCFAGTQARGAVADEA